MRAPFEALAQAARGVGHNLFVLDTDGPLRRTTPFLRSEGHPVPSLAMAAYLALARVTPASVRLDGRILTAAMPGCRCSRSTCRGCRARPAPNARCTR